MKREHTIDATGQRLGRVASEIAKMLMGKDTPQYKPNEVEKITITVENTSKMVIDPRKMQYRTYDRYSGYPGGRKVETMQQVVDKKGFAELIRQAVRGMLPSNRLRSRMMNNLIINE